MTICKFEYICLRLLKRDVENYQNVTKRAKKSSCGPTFVAHVTWHLDNILIISLQYGVMCRLAGLQWGWHFNPHTHPIPTAIPIGIPIGIPIPTEPEVSTLLHHTCRPTIPHRQILAVC